MKTLVSSAIVINVAAEDYEAKRHIAAEMLQCVDAGIAAIKYVRAVEEKYKVKKLGTELNQSAYLQMKLMMEEFLNDTASFEMTSQQMVELLMNYKTDVRMLRDIAQTYRRNVWLARNLFGISEPLQKTRHRDPLVKNLALLAIIIALAVINLVN